MAGIAFNMFTIDTLQFSERLIKEGMEPKLAKVLVEEFKEIGQQSLDVLATKADIKDVRKDLQISIQNLLIKLGSLIIFVGFAVAGFITWYMTWYLDKIISGHFPLH